MSLCGTAIALRLGHRVSVDFDFFNDLPLDKGQLRETFDFMANAITLQESKETLTVMTQPNPELDVGVKVSFFGAIDFGRVGIPKCTREEVLQAASLDDLIANKLNLLLQRVEAKDYRDIIALVRNGVRLSDGLSATRALFGNTFQPSEALKALTWFQGGDLGTLTTDEQNILIQAARQVGDLPDVERISSTLNSH